VKLYIVREVVILVILPLPLPIIRSTGHQYHNTADHRGIVETGYGKPRHQAGAAHHMASVLTFYTQVCIHHSKKELSRKFIIIVVIIIIIFLVSVSGNGDEEDLLSCEHFGEDAAHAPNVHLFVVGGVKEDLRGSVPLCDYLGMEQTQPVAGGKVLRNDAHKQVFDSTC